MLASFFSWTYYFIVFFLGLGHLWASFSLALNYELWPDFWGWCPCILSSHSVASTTCIFLLWVSKHSLTTISTSIPLQYLLLIRIIHYKCFIFFFLSKIIKIIIKLFFRRINNKLLIPGALQLMHCLLMWFLASMILNCRLALATLSTPLQDSTLNLKGTSVMNLWRVNNDSSWDIHMIEMAIKWD